jgi:adenine-specific DNA-methyltransferase
VFYGWNKVDKFMSAWRRAGFRIVGHLTFIKRYASAQRFVRYQHENAYLLAKGNPQKPDRVIPDVLEYEYSGNHLHPTQKPLSVLTPLIDSFSNPGDAILDPFCGSGSTVIAAQRLGRHCVGIEIDAEYFGVARRRLNSGPREHPVPGVPQSRGQLHRTRFSSSDVQHTASRILTAVTPENSATPA